MSQRVDLIINCVNNASKAVQDVMSSFQGMAAKFSVLNYTMESAYQRVKDVLDKTVLNTARLGDELSRMNQITGISVGELYAFKNTAERSNISLGELGMVFNFLSRNIFEARNKAGDARAIFEALGVNTARPLEQIIRDLAMRFSELKDGEDKQALALQLFGRSGSQIIPLLNDIANGAEEVSTVFSDNLAKESSALQNNFTELKQSVEKLSISFGSYLIPALNQFFDDIKERRGITGLLIQQFRDMWDAAKWATKPLSDVSKMAGDALDSMLGYNKVLGETQRLIKNSPTKLSQLEFTFPMAKKDVPLIITDEQRKRFVDNEEKMAELVDKTGQEILDNLDKRDRAEKEHARVLQAARESEIQLQLKELDLAQQNFKINRPEATRQRAQFYRELLTVQQEYLNSLDKEKDPASWYAQQNAINETRQSLVELNLAMKEQFGTLSEGIGYGLRKYVQDANTAFQSGAEFAQSAAQAMHDAFQQIFFDGLQGKFKSLGDYFKGFLNMIQQAWAKAMSDMMSKAMSKGFDWIGGLLGIAGAGLGGGLGGGPGSGFGGGGGWAIVHSGGYIPRFHVGGLAHDEVPAILQRGEYVVSRKGVDALDRINNGQFGGREPSVIVQQSVNFNVSSLDGQDAARVLKGHSGTIRQIVSDGVQQSRVYASQIRGG